MVSASRLGQVARMTAHWNVVLGSKAFSDIAEPRGITRHDDERVAVRRQDPREFQANAARRAGDQRGFFAPRRNQGGLLLMRSIVARRRNRVMNELAGISPASQVGAH